MYLRKCQSMSCGVTMELSYNSGVLFQELGLPSLKTQLSTKSLLLNLFVFFMFLAFLWSLCTILIFFQAFPSYDEHSTEKANEGEQPARKDGTHKSTERHVSMKGIITQR